MILPIVKQQFHHGGLCAVPEKITVSHKGGADARLGAEAFVTFVPSTVSAADAFVRFAPDPTLEDRAEIYRVTVTADHILVGFRDARGAVNGAATAALLLRGGKVETCEIVDYPGCAYRSILIDMARGLPEKKEIETAIRYMALAKYNRLHLHLIDDKGPCYRSEAVPEYAFLGRGGQCDIDDLQKLEELCASYAIEIVPEIEIPAHANALCAAHPEFKCEVENAHTWAICPGNDDIWPFFEALIGEVAAIFPRSEYIHIGTDELEFRDLPTPRLCHWDECPRCAALRAREGLKDRCEEFYYVVERMHDIVRAHGKKMMMWNDQIDISKEVPVSRDILIQFWRVAGKGRGPHEGCSMEKFLEQGFRVVNAYYPCTYFDIESYMSVEKMKTWTPYTVPEQSPQYADQVIGGEACAWEFGNVENYPFYSYVTPAVVAVFGDKLWGLGEREHNEEYRAALAAFLFGDPSLSELFDLIGGILPPRKPEMLTYTDPAAIDRTRLQSCIERVETAPCCPAAEGYITWLKRIAAE